MTPGELIDMALAVYQSLGWTLLKLTALPSAFCLASVIFILEYVLPSFGLTSHPGDVHAQVWEASFTLALAFAVGGPLFLIGLSYSSGIVVALVSDFMLGRMPSAEGAVAGGKRTLKGLFVLSLYELVVAWSGVLLATVLLMVSAVLPESSEAFAAIASALSVFAYIAGFIVLPFVLLRHALAPALVFLEGLSPARAAKRSVSLMQGTPWQPSGYNSAWLLAGCIAILLLLLLPGLGAALEWAGLSQVRFATGVPLLSQLIGRAVSYLPYYLALWTLVPVWCTGITLLYFERRIRVEGFDIETLAQDIWRSDKRNRFEI